SRERKPRYRANLLCKPANLTPRETFKGGIPFMPTKSRSRSSSSRSRTSRSRGKRSSRRKYSLSAGSDVKARDASVQTWETEIGPKRKNREDTQTSHRDWPIGSATEGKESSVKEE